jgi:hypothetical protein
MRGKEFLPDVFRSSRQRVGVPRSRGLPWLTWWDRLKPELQPDAFRSSRQRVGVPRSRGLPLADVMGPTKAGTPT